ncbi:quinone oxidoreductase [Methylocaldum marinum]|uniref:Quinone oxidoreductase n=2 Tax=Methylocaldum marinum TaxID=1432792 RepID=A0A250KSN7_9GAMM|nr:quinone oxidoreductase [Methylocaldum marinum]
MSAAPANMTAIEIIQWGGPEVLQACRRTTPQPGPGEVLIKVAAAGVNRPDVMQRKGLYPPPPGASDIPGLEIAGEIVALGDGVGVPAVGSWVCALVTGGGYAEYCSAAAALCLPIPKGLGPVEAAAVPETFFTVWTNVFERGGLRAGESVLVHGGGSGIGTTAIQLARVFGATVFVTAGSAEKCRFCERLGARAINYREEDFVDRIQTLTEGKGVNLILDMIGGPYLQRNLSCLAVDGRLVVIAVQGGAKAEINLLPIFLNRLTLTGSTLRPRSVNEKAAIANALRQNVWPLLESGQVKPVVYANYPLVEASEAHSLMESGRHVGKIVLSVV